MYIGVGKGQDMQQIDAYLRVIRLKPPDYTKSNIIPQLYKTCIT